MCGSPYIEKGGFTRGRGVAINFDGSLNFLLVNLKIILIPPLCVCPCLSRMTGLGPTKERKKKVDVTHRERRSVLLEDTKMDGKEKEGREKERKI